MESQLLECLEALSSAGDDERARLRKVSRTVGYEELPKSWKALVRIAAAKTSPKRQDEGASGSKKAPRRWQEGSPIDLRPKRSGYWRRERRQPCFSTLQTYIATIRCQ